jgi:hypothetical protein
MALVRWAAIALLLLEAAAAALYAFLLAAVAAAYWQSELSSHQAQPRLSWLDVLTQTALLVAVFVVFAALPAGIALGAARRRTWWLWAGAVYELAWAVLLTPVIVGLAEVSRLGYLGAILFAIAALGPRKRRARRT